MSKSKYFSKKTEVDGIVFDSKAESQFYSFLKMLKQKPLLQPTFLLQEKIVTKKYLTISEINYVADFQIENIVFDVKGIETADFAIKKKLFMAKFPQLTLILVKGSSYRWSYYRGKVCKGTETTLQELLQ